MGFLSFSIRQTAPAQTCLLCHDSDAVSALCNACLKDLRVSAPDAARLCPRCGGPGGGVLCGACQRKPPPFERLWASLRYEPPVSGILHQFKHRRDVSLARPLALLMAALPPPWLEEAGIEGVLAVPLSRQRRLFRGFNQCDELAVLLARRYGWPLLPRSTVFRQASAPQSTLDFEARRRNVRGIFKADTNVNERNILLIDDVVTSGTTLEELSRTLRRAGAKAVYCWTLSSAKLKKY